jgi:secretion/DNA translocation related TadE-like protein
VSRERGNVAILMVAAIALAGFLALAVAQLGAAAARDGRADTAADAAALAAADALAEGKGPAGALAAARRIAAANGARLESCRCAGAAADVTVVAGDAHARARAEIDP